MDQITRRALLSLGMIASACGGSAAVAQTTGQAPASATGQAPASATDPAAAPREGLPLDHVFEYQVPADPTSTAAQMMQMADAPFIQVNGMGQVSVTPDLAKVAFAVESRATTADAAADENATKMAAVLRALRNANLPGLELETYGYRLNPEYRFDEQDRTQSIVGYTAMNNVRATVSDVDAAGRVIDTAIRAGANRVAGLSFEASDTRQARLDALTRAVEVAREEATAIAAALGRRLGAPLEVHGGAQVPGPRPMPMDGMMMMRQEAAADTPIETGDQLVTAQVSVKFALGESR